MLKLTLAIFVSATFLIFGVLVITLAVIGFLSAILPILASLTPHRALICISEESCYHGDVLALVAGAIIVALGSLAFDPILDRLTSCRETRARRRRQRNEYL